MSPGPYDQDRDPRDRDPRFPPPSHRSGFTIPQEQRAEIDEALAEMHQAARAARPVVAPVLTPGTEIPAGWRAVKVEPRRLGPIPVGRAMTAVARWLHRHASASITVDDWGNR